MAAAGEQQAIKVEDDDAAANAAAAAGEAQAAEVMALELPVPRQMQPVKRKVGAALSCTGSSSHLEPRHLTQQLLGSAG